MYVCTWFFLLSFAARPGVDEASKFKNSNNFTSSAWNIVTRAARPSRRLRFYQEDLYSCEMLGRFTPSSDLSPRYDAYHAVHATSGGGAFQFRGIVVADHLRRRTCALFSRGKHIYSDITIKSENILGFPFFA